MPSLLVVDDEPGVRESLRMLFKDDCDVTTAESVSAALESLDRNQPDLVLLDLVMPGRSGLELLAELSQRVDPPRVVVLTATKTLATAVEAMKRGAVDYVTKPFEVEALRMKVHQLLEHRALEQEVERLRAQVDERERLGGLVGGSRCMQDLFRTITRVATSNATVLIGGESGTGKELAARAIHDGSDRSDGPYVAVNCAAIPANLIESELFGHERGSFTGALERRIGKFESADRGTLFLDEIGELDIAFQAKLLRALQEREVERIGGSRPIPIDVRVISATNRNLERDVEAGRFRSDLFFRIHVVSIEMPSLMDRRNDIPRLVEHFLERSRVDNEHVPKRVAREAMTAMDRYPWPGNVRELENAVLRAVTLCEGDVIQASDLPPAVIRASRDESLRDAVRQGRVSLEDAVAEFEESMIREAMGRANGNQTVAADTLKTTRRRLKRKMDRLGIKTVD